MIVISSVTIPTLPAIVSFLEKNEQSHIALISHILRNGIPCLPPSDIKYYVAHEENALFSTGTIRAVIAIDKGGTLLHAVESPSSADDLRPALSELLSTFDIFCLMGDAEGSQFLRSLIKEKASHIRSYHIMEWVKTGRRVYQPGGTELVTCTVADANELMLIKKGYYLEEQSLPGGTFYPAAHLKLLQQELATQKVLALRSLREENHPFAAKANTNAIGLRWVQLGGVYTMPAWRGKGCARYLVQQLAEFAEKQGYKTALFVKTQNTSAQKAYLAAGFEQTRSFEISYFSK